MKKINLKHLKAGVNEKLTREQLKNMFGGFVPGPTSDRLIYCCKEFTYDCNYTCVSTCGVGQYAKYC